MTIAERKAREAHDRENPWRPMDLPPPVGLLVDLLLPNLGGHHSHEGVRYFRTQYVNRALRQIRRFALRHQVLAIVVAHPTKDVGKGGDARTPTLYDIEGSAAWYNKPDHGIVIDVPDPDLKETVVLVKKARFSWSGKKGDVVLEYVPEIEGYRSLGGALPLSSISSVRK